MLPNWVERALTIGKCVAGLNGHEREWSFRINQGSNDAEMSLIPNLVGRVYCKADLKVTQWVSFEQLQINLIINTT